MNPAVSVVVVLSLCALAGTAAAEQSDENLAKQLQNPVASLISVPFQSNFDFGIGPDDDGWRQTLNVQPVVPISISQDWNVISRTIVPLIHQDDVFEKKSSESGIGDITQSLFLSPKEPGAGGLIWGIGPALLLDAATRDEFGADQWGAGPTLVVLRQSAGWTYGMLTNHIWGFSGDEDRGDVDATFLQPFLSHTWKRGFSLTVNTESSYDWEAEQWTVPINFVASQVLKLGPQRVSVFAGVRHQAEAPRGGPDWGLRAGVTLLFPK